MATSASHHRAGIGRRRFFTFAIAAAGTASLPVRTLLAGRKSDEFFSPRDELPGLVNHLQSAKTVGKAYLRRFPDEGDFHALSRYIGLDARIEFQRKTGDLVPERRERALKRWARDRIRADFSDGRVVDLDGWILSQFEVRLCALVYLAA